MAGGMDGDLESGRIGEAVRARGGELHWFYRRRGDRLPESLEQYHGLIVFGGEVSVHDPALKPYFDQLSELILRFHDAGKPILGSCLGCQSIARAFGAEVYPQGFLEYGFAPLKLNQAASNDPLLADLEPEQTLFEMHSDTFDLPEQATLLMEGEAVTHQAFRIGELTYGFQCHFEVTPEIVDIWTRRELIDNPDQDQRRVAELVEQAKRDFARYQGQQTRFANTLMRRWLDLI